MIAGGIVLVEAAALKLRSGRIGGRVAVRCRRGHLFTTIWIPGVKLKELDLVIARIQRCPVGHHWSLVVPVRPATLTAENREFAQAHHDVKIP